MVIAMSLVWIFIKNFLNWFPTKSNKWVWFIFRW
jgi:uncharacterized protein YggT (Ycf19 family)